MQYALAFGMLQIHGEGSFVAVEFQKSRRQIGIFSSAKKTKRVHAALARFDFDHVGTELGQNRRPVRSGKHVIEAHDAHAMERAIARWSVISTGGRNLRSLTFVRDGNRRLP